MSITGISAAAVLPAQVLDPVASDIRALQSAIAQGNITVAQSAFASVQAAITAMPQTAPQAKQFSQTTQLGQAFDALRTALQAGDATGAQQAYAAVQAALKANRAAASVSSAADAASAAQAAVSVPQASAAPDPGAAAGEAAASEAETTVGTTLSAHA